MTNVYIITKEGRKYSDEGLSYVSNMIKDNFNVNDELLFSMGYEYNNPKHLVIALNANPEAYIIISTSQDIVTVPPINNEVIKDMLNENLNRTSWEILMENVVFESRKDKH